MSYSTFTNRNGKLLVGESLITPEITSILSRLNKDIDGVLDQDDLLSLIAEVQEEMAGIATSQSFDMSIAIFINAKNYLIKDEDELIGDLGCHDIDLYLDVCHCFKPSNFDSIYGPEMYFITEASLLNL